MPQTETLIRRRPWLGLVLTTLLSVGVTIVVAWYQIVRSEKQAVLAELERAKVVQESLVSVVEEHVLNGRAIDIPRISRLIELRRKQERVALQISATDIIERAEFNILSSRYLSFEAKEKHKGVFDRLYQELISRSPVRFTNVPHAELLNDVAVKIREGKSTEALDSLGRVAAALRDDRTVFDLRRRPDDPLEVILKTLSEDPFAPLALLIIFLVTFFVSMPPPLRRRLVSWLSTWSESRRGPRKGDSGITEQNTEDQSSEKEKTTHNPGHQADG